MNAPLLWGPLARRIDAAAQRMRRGRIGYLITASTGRLVQYVSEKSQPEHKIVGFASVFSDHPDDQDSSRLGRIAGRSNSISNVNAELSTSSISNASRTAEVRGPSTVSLIEDVRSEDIAALGLGRVGGLFLADQSRSRRCLWEAAMRPDLPLRSGAALT